MSNQAKQRYISKVRIENFQSHEDTEFDLSPGINLIVGSSEAGKSAILRAINFAMHNEPKGDDFVRIERDETRVHLWWSDGCYLCRIKGHKRNAVIIRDKDGFETGFDRIGGSLPQEALDILGNPPIDPESGPLSYSDQHQPLFLVTLSASELPKTISRLTGIDDFEDAAELLNKESNAANKKIKDSAKRIENYDNQLKEFDNLDNQLQELDEMEQTASQIDNIVLNLQKAQTLKDGYDNIRTLGRTANIALKEAQNVAVFADELTPIGEILNKVTSAQNLSEKYKSTATMETDATTALKTALLITSETNMQNLESVSAILNSIREAKALLQKYNNLRAQGKKIKAEHDAWSQKLEILNTDYQELVERLRETNLWCDTCKRLVTTVDIGGCSHDSA
jgi:DNA repair protein SbcC/Rad50